MTTPLSEKLCPHCLKIIPITRDGKVAKHYGTFKKVENRGFKRSGSVQLVCKGSGEEV